MHHHSGITVIKIRLVPDTLVQVLSGKYFPRILHHEEQNMILDVRHFHGPASYTDFVKIFIDLYSGKLNILILWFLLCFFLAPVHLPRLTSALTRPSSSE